VQYRIAVSFYFSNVFVARDRFLKPEFLNRLIGLPLYYFGQFLLPFQLNFWDNHFVSVHRFRVHPVKFSEGNPIEQGEPFRLRPGRTYAPEGVVLTVNLSPSQSHHCNTKGLCI
jgi:hypothetical protein